jgi:hypothetical protein
MTRDDYKIRRLNEWRVIDGAGAWNSSELDGFNGAFILHRSGRRLLCIASDQGGWEHVSVTDQTTKRSQEVPPSWDEMCYVKRCFWDDEETVVEYHVRLAEWIDEHPGCLHLWRPIDVEIPRPPSLYVGISTD